MYKYRVSHLNLSPPITRLGGQYRKKFHIKVVWFRGGTKMAYFSTFGFDRKWVTLTGNGFFKWNSLHFIAYFYSLSRELFKTL